MVCQYKQICRQHKCKVKVFTQMPSAFNKKIGTPDLVVLFTNTVSHKMEKCPFAEEKNKKIEIVRSQKNSQAALKEILEEKRR